MQLCHVRYNDECSNEVTPVTSLDHFYCLCTQDHLQTEREKRGEEGGERGGKREERGEERGRREGRERERGEREGRKKGGEEREEGYVQEKERRR